jgi:hypothetical protein
MKYIKMLGLASVAAAALMAFIGAGTASATELYSTSGTLGKGTTIHADAESTLTLQAGFSTINCTESTVHGEITNAGSATTTVSGPITKKTGLTFGGCDSTVHVLKEGSLEIHHIAGTTNGTLTSSGAEVTVIKSGVHCIYETSNTHIGTLTGSTTGHATLHIEANLKRVPTSFLCADNAAWEGEYTVTQPSPLWVHAS